MGKKQSYQYAFTDSEGGYSIKVRGLKDNLDKLKVTNLIPSINVEGYGPGIYTFTVNLKEIKGVEVLDTLMVELEIKSEE